MASQILQRQYGNLNKLVEIKYVNEENGYSMVASEDIAPLETCVSVPLKLCLRGEEDSELLEGTMDEKLALRLMLAKYHGENSEHYAYMQSLPTSYDTPLFWSGEDFELLKGTNVYLLTNMLRRELDYDFERLLVPLINSDPEKYAHAISRESYYWAMSTIYSRAFGVTVNGEYTHVLCPVMDMFNHDVSLAEKYDLDDFIAVDDKNENILHRMPFRVTKGEPVFISYGKYSNAKLLFTYGFVDPRNTIRAIDYWINLPKNDALYERKAILLQNCELTNQQTYDFRGTLFGDSISERLLATLRIIFVIDEEMDRAHLGFKSAIISYRNESKVYSVLAASLSKKLENVNIGDGTHSIDSMSTHAIMAIALRQEEYGIVRDSIATLQRWQEQLNPNDLSVYPPGKNSS